MQRQYSLSEKKHHPYQNIQIKSHAPYIIKKYRKNFTFHRLENADNNVCMPDIYVVFVYSDDKLKKKKKTKIEFMRSYHRCVEEV